MKDIPAQTLKIDKSFVDDIATDADSQSYLKLIVDLAKNRNKNIVVEGVETKEQVNLLSLIECESIQGYYFSRPLPVSDFTELLEGGSVLPNP